MSALLKETDRLENSMLDWATVEKHFNQIRRDDAKWPSQVQTQWPALIKLVKNFWCSTKCGEFFWPTERLLASQCGLCYMNQDTNTVSERHKNYKPTSWPMFILPYKNTVQKRLPYKSHTMKASFQFNSKRCKKNHKRQNKCDLSVYHVTEK